MCISYEQHLTRALNFNVFKVTTRLGRAVLCCKVRLNNVVFRMRRGKNSKEICIEIGYGECNSVFNEGVEA